MKKYFLMAVLASFSLSGFSTEPVLSSQVSKTEFISSTKDYSKILMGRGRGRRRRGRESEQEGLSLGFRAGINMGTIENVAGDKGYQPAAYKYNTGLSVAGIFNIGVSSVFSIQTELMFIQKGYRLDEGSETRTVSGVKVTVPIAEQSLNLNYLEVPVLARFSIGGDAFKVLLSVGPTFGYMLSASETTHGETESVDTEGAKRFEMGITGGAGFALSAGPGRIILESRLGYSFTDIGESGAGSNLGFLFGAGYVFPLQ